MLTPKCFITSQKKKKKKKNCYAMFHEKGLRFVVISNDQYCEKVYTQIDRSSLLSFLMT